MANAVLFIGWDRPNPGKENEVFGHLSSKALEDLARWQGKYFERMEVVALTPHCANLNGFILLLGERAKLDELRRTDEFEAFSLTLNALVAGYGVVPGVNLEGIKAVMARRR